MLGYLVEPGCEHGEKRKSSRPKLILAREMSGTTAAMRTGRFELESVGKEARCDITTARDGVTENDKGIVVKLSVVVSLSMGDLSRRMLK